MLFQHHQALAPADLAKYARMLALDANRFEEDMRSAQVIKRVKDDGSVPRGIDSMMLKASRR
jgi:hypothetical protein